MLRKLVGLAGLTYLLLAPASVCRAEKYALVVGINDYKFYGPTNDPTHNLPPFDLFGCVNDANETKKFLISQGFKEANITFITDQAATKAAMTAAMAAATQKVKSGDVFYFHFSGHGFQMTAKDAATEDDAQDELIACADYSGDPFAAGNPNGDAGCIRDDDIAAWISSINTKKKLFIFDCCHSGTISRGLTARSRRLPAVRTARKIPAGRGLTVAARNLPGRKDDSFGDAIRAVASKRRSLAPDFVVLSACKDDQTAADTGQFGAFSYNLLEAYKKSAPQDPITDVLGVASRGIASKGMSQEPQPALGGAYQATPASATLRGLLTDSAAGTEVQPTAAPPLPAVPQETSEKIMVKLVGLDNGTLSTLQQGLNGTTYAQATQANENRAVIKDATSGKTSLVTADGVVIVDVTGLDGAAIQRKIDPYLVQAYLMKKLAVLDNPKSRFNVSAQLLKTRNLVMETDAASDDPSRPTIFVGDPVFFNVTVDKPAFLTLIDVGTDGQTIVLFPNQFMPASVQAQPGQPAQFPPPGGPISNIRVGGPVGTEMVLVLATTKPLDLSQFQPQTLPSLAGARSINTRNAVQLGLKSKNLILETVGTEEGWGSAILLANVKQKNQ